MIHHVALTVNCETDICDFYEKILQLSKSYDFQLTKELSKLIFDIEEEAKVVVLKREDIQVEIFLSQIKEQNVFSHTCLTYRDSESVFNKMQSAGYKCVIKQNANGSDTYFIWDKSGNMFEIKEEE